MIRIWNTTTGPNDALDSWTCAASQNDFFQARSPTACNRRRRRLLKIWSLNSEIPVADLKGHGQWVTSIAFTPDGEKLASGSADHTVRVWSLTEFKEIAQYTDSSDWIPGSRTFSPDGKQIAMAGANQPIRLWNIENGQHQLLKGHRGNKIFGLDFSLMDRNSFREVLDAMIKSGT